MSTAPIAGVVFPPLGREHAEARGIRGRLGQIIGRAIADVRSVPRYLMRYSVMVLAVFGLLALWDAHGDGQIPSPSPLMSADKAPRRCSSPLCIMEGVSDDERWRGLAAALAILEEVNPQVASWVRERYEHGALVFSNRYTGERDNRASLARYDHFRCRLIVQRGLFAQEDGEIAAILCHEYRHSRQNMAKPFKCALSMVVTADGDRSILENDALLYEHEARIAIFGGGRWSANDAASLRTTGSAAARAVGSRRPGRESVARAVPDASVRMSPNWF